MFSLPHWLFPGDDRPTAEIDDEIEEELRLHLDLLAEQRIREGLPAEEAQQQAAERFGDLDSLKRRCRAEKQGEIPMLKRVQVLLIAVLVAVMGVMGWQQWAMAERAEATWRIMDGISGRLSDISDRLHLLEPEALGSQPITVVQPNVNPGWRVPPPALASNPATPRVLTGPNGARIVPLPPPETANAWGNQYFPELKPHEQATKTIVLVRNEAGDPVTAATAYGIYATREGESVLDDLPLGEHGRAEWSQTSEPAIHRVVIEAPGYARTTHSFGRDRSGDHAVTLKLDETVPYELKITKADGSPAKHMSVIPVRRTDLEDNSHDFPTETRSLWRRTNAEGRLMVDWLAPSDIATVLLKERGKPIESAITVEFEAPRDASRVISMTLNGGNRYGGGEYGGGGFGGEYGGGFGAPEAYDVKVTDRESERPSDKSSRSGRRSGRRYGGGEFGGGGYGGEFGVRGETEDVTAGTTSAIEENETTDVPEHESE